MINYTIHYGVLPSRKIYNFVGPDSIDDYNLSFEEKFIKHKNSQKYIDEKINFYNNLNNDIINNKILNPILVNCGKINPYMQICLPKKVLQTNFIICNYLGGSRLYITQKHNMEIPCIISDFTEKFNHYEKLITTNQIKEKFTDKNFNIFYLNYGLKLKYN